MERELRDDFIEWFTGLLLKQDFCWERDLLRSIKHELWEAYKLTVKPDNTPVGTAKEKE